VARQERANPSVEKFWQLPADEMCRRLGVGEGGLSREEASRRLGQGGPNIPAGRKRGGPWGILLGQFKSPIILILIFAALASLYFGNYLDASIILGIIVASGLLGFFQEFSASNALGKLLQVVKVTATVKRGGQSLDVPVEEVVPGDLVMLDAGSLVPADCLLIQTADLYVDEAILTGETMPVRKAPGSLASESPTLVQMSNALFQGTHIRSGTGLALVVATGGATEFGRIASRLKLKPPQTEFEVGVSHFGYLLLEVTLVLIFLIFALNVLLQRPVLESLLFSLALAVGLVPQLLPAIISINLSKGAQAMARKKVIVKRLAAIENFGSMEVLCTDKTGTLTEGKVRLHATLDASGADSEKVFLYSYLNASMETGIHNPIDEALLNARKLDVTGYSKRNEIPYDFVRKRLSLVVEDPQGHIHMITKGALEKVLEVSTTVEEGGTVQPLADHAEEIQRRFVEWSNQGYRVLGLACRELKPGEYGPGSPPGEPKDERGMTFLGFLLFLDPPKADARESLQKLASLGVRVKVITGDNRLVAATIAGQVGLAHEEVITGEDLKKMSEEALVAKVRQVDLFAEIEPNQKERIIRAVRKSGAVTGYMGDGINDAPALHVADVGISVNSAVDVAKDAADIVMLEPGLSTLADGVLEGRHTFANTIKYVFMATSANFGNMFSVAGASLFLSFLPMLPTQILLTNFLTDFPELTIATDSVDPEQVQIPRRWDIRFIRRFMIVFGLLSSIFDYATFGALLLLLGATPETFRTGWFVESVLSASLVVLIIRTRRPFWRSRPSPYLAGITALVALVVIILPYSGPIARAFGFTPLPWTYWLLLAGILTTYLVCAETVKHFFYRSNARRPEGPGKG
jgi:Mg2+-importing ATPase